MGAALSSHPVYQPLKRAVRKNDVAAIRALLEGVDNPSQKSSLAHRAARWAFEANALESFELVLSPLVGFSPQEELGTGDKVLLKHMVMKAGLGCVDESRFPLFLSAAVRAGVVLDHHRYGATPPLFYATCGNHVAVMRALLSAGADPNWKGPDIADPIFVHCSSVDAVRLLLEFGVDSTAATSSLRGSLTGGICFLLHKWPREEELPALLDAFLDNGGTFVTPMEGIGGEKVPLAVTIMFRKVGSSPSWMHSLTPEIQEVIERAEQEEQKRRHLLQELLVGRGLDLNASSPYRFPWKEFIPEHGSERLKRLLELEEALPKASRPPTKSRF